MSVHLSMKFSDKVYTRMTRRMYWVHACIYFYSWFFCPEWEGTYLYILLRLSTYDVQLLFPACARPARLHPAGPPAPCGHAAHSKAAHSLQQQDTLGQEQITVLLCRQLQGSPKAASSSAVAEPLAALAAPASCSELDSYVVWATNLHLNVVARGRAPEIDSDRLYPPSWGCLDRKEQLLFRYGRECAVMTLKSLHKSKQLYFSQSAFKRSAIMIIEEHRNWSCVAGQKLIFRESSWIFHSVTSPCVPSIDCFDSNQQILIHTCIENLNSVWQCQIKIVNLTFRSSLIGWFLLLLHL